MKLYVLIFHVRHNVYSYMTMYIHILVYVCSSKSSRRPNYILSYVVCRNAFVIIFVQLLSPCHQKSLFHNCTVITFAHFFENFLTGTECSLLLEKGALMTGNQPNKFIAQLLSLNVNIFERIFIITDTFNNEDLASFMNRLRHTFSLRVTKIFVI